MHYISTFLLAIFMKAVQTIPLSDSFSSDSFSSFTDNNNILNSIATNPFGFQPNNLVSMYTDPIGSPTNNPDSVPENSQASTESQPSTNTGSLPGTGPSDLGSDIQLANLGSITNTGPSDLGSDIQLANLGSTTDTGSNPFGSDFQIAGVKPLKTEFDWNDVDQWDYSYSTTPNESGEIRLGGEFWMCPKIAQSLAFMCCNVVQCIPYDIRASACTRTRLKDPVSCCRTYNSDAHKPSYKCGMTAIHYPRPSSPSDQLTKEVLNFINDVCDDFCHDLFPQIGIDPMPSTFDWSDSNQWEYSYLTRPKVNGNIPLGDDFWICPKIAEPFAFMCCNHGKCDSFDIDKPACTSDMYEPVSCCRKYKSNTKSTYKCGMTAIHYPRPEDPSLELTRDVTNFIHDICDERCQVTFHQN